MYPNANIWLTGHSLGGGLAALLGATFGAPVVAFESPAERMASRRLHLPSPVCHDLEIIIDLNTQSFKIAFHSPYNTRLSYSRRTCVPSFSPSLAMN